MTPDELAAELRPYVRRHVPGGGEQFLDQLLGLAHGDKIMTLVEQADESLGDEHADRQYLLEHLIQDIRRVLRPAPEPRATVLLFKRSGKWYTEEEWRIPRQIKDHSPQRGHFVREAIGPWDMRHSPDFRRIDGGAVLVPAQEPWGYPHLFPAES